jgi:hypothetical protein
MKKWKYGTFLGVTFGQLMLAGAIAVLALGCGPSVAQVKAAQGARYKASMEDVYEVALEVTRETYKIADRSVEAGAVLTMGRWYSPDGQSESAGVGNSVKVEDGSMMVALLVKVHDEQGIVRVEVTPLAERFRLGRPNADKVLPGDPSMPGWVTGKAEGLAVAIHERVKSRGLPISAP